MNSDQSVHSQTDLRLYRSLFGFPEDQRLCRTNKDYTGQTEWKSHSVGCKSNYNAFWFLRSCAVKGIVVSPLVVVIGIVRMSFFHSYILILTQLL